MTLKNKTGGRRRWRTLRAGGLPLNPLPPRSARGMEALRRSAADDPNAFQGVFGQPKLRDQASKYSNGAFLIDGECRY